MINSNVTRGGDGGGGDHGIGHHGGDGGVEVSVEVN